MRIVRHSGTYGAPVEFSFNYVADYRHTSDYVLGLHRLTPLTAVVRGLGAKFEGVIDIGPMKLTMFMEVNRWAEGEMIGMHCKQKGLDVEIEVVTKPVQLDVPAGSTSAQSDVPAGSTSAQSDVPAGSTSATSADTGHTNMDLVVEYAVGGGIAGRILDAALAVFAKLAIAHLDHVLRAKIEASYAAAQQK